MTTFLITDNRIGAPTLLETPVGSEAKAFCATLGEWRLYRNGMHVAIIVSTPEGVMFRSAFDTFESLFSED